MIGCAVTTGSTLSTKCQALITTAIVCQAERRNATHVRKWYKPGRKRQMKLAHGWIAPIALMN
ncbi:hypothetical protein RvY_08358 [Ramazzottius varieornatus]|uniref:Uncharacterized protein n=1 Tax=Ramazzottius varieornatus TaxID=947166 RepID=A0A1D1V886_RAMVA|nr:hypothetical protein RvY_08358 [Ramazzottius varieornatus]